MADEFLLLPLPYVELCRAQSPRSVASLSSWAVPPNRVPGSASLGLCSTLRSVVTTCQLEDQGGILSKYDKLLLSFEQTSLSLGAGRTAFFAGLAVLPEAVTGS